VKYFLTADGARKIKTVIEKRRIRKMASGTMHPMHSMKRRAMNFHFSLAVALTMALMSRGAASAQSNTLLGNGAFASNVSGQDDTALGYNALSMNSSGNSNTATGSGALDLNTTGTDNTATGDSALIFNDGGSFNTATGSNALNRNTEGNYNTATGAFALFNNTGGLYETAVGGLALQDNTTGNYNTAAGYRALIANKTGARNTGAGVNALYKNTSGQSNTGVGVNVMLNNTTGSNNIALGDSAGSNLTVGSNNIEIGNPGLAAEANAIHIGKQGTQTKTYIAGISGAAVTGADVVVASDGRLGVGPPSSARYKHDIHDMGGASSKLLKLRPVTFRYNQDPTSTVQYGLVAEEVAKVYPELVVYGPDGKVLTVRYSMLGPMLLNELQKQSAALDNQTRRNAQQAERISQLSAELAYLKAGFEKRLSALEYEVAARDGKRKLAAAFNR
jgi:hypothetical protein